MLDSFWDIMSIEDNKNYFTKKVCSWVTENLKDAFGYCCRKQLSLNDYLPPERFGGQINQATVFITVRMSDLWENGVYETIKEIFGQIEIDTHHVKRWTTNEGDLQIFNEIWELKTSQAKNSWTGATHSSHKVGRYLLINYSVDRSLKLKLVNESKFIPMLGIFLLDVSKIIPSDGKNIWSGKPTKNNSFTTLKIKKDWVIENKIMNIWGHLQTNLSSKTKFAKIIKKRNPNITIDEHSNSEL